MYYSDFFFFFFGYCNFFSCTTWSVEKNRVVSLFFLFSCLAGLAEGNDFFFFKLRSVFTKCYVRYVSLSWCFSCGQAEKKIIPRWKVLGSFFVVEARVPKNVVIWVKGEYCFRLYI